MAKTSKPLTSTASNKYTCLAPIRLDGTLYAVGDEITLAEEQARQLLFAEAVEPKAKKTTGDNA